MLALVLLKAMSKQQGSQIQEGSIIDCLERKCNEARTALREPEPDLAAQVRALVEALKDAQWTTIEEDRPVGFCPVCDRLQPYGHTEECVVGKALASDAARLFGPES